MSETVKCPSCGREQQVVPYAGGAATVEASGLCQECGKPLNASSAAPSGGVVSGNLEINKPPSSKG
jgi:transposase-like protein